MPELPSAGTVTSALTGRIIPCCWAECDRHGRHEFSIRVIDTVGAFGQPTKTTTYLFCSERHRLYYVRSVGAYGQLPAGASTIDSHLRVPAQPWKGNR